MSAEEDTAMVRSWGSLRELVMLEDRRGRLAKVKVRRGGRNASGARTIESTIDR
jgi:hypothetical protein